MDLYTLFYLTSFTHNVIHVIVCTSSSSFLLLSSIPFVARQQFAFSPIDRHLGCFHFEVITNKATMDIYVPALVWTYTLIYLELIPRRAMVKSYGLDLTFKDTAKLLSRGVALFHIPPTTVYEGPSSSTSLSTIGMSVFLILNILKDRHALIF